MDSLIELSKILKVPEAEAAGRVERHRDTGTPMVVNGNLVGLYNSAGRPERVGDVVLTYNTNGTLDERSKRALAEL